uniref:Y-box-binding protein 2-B-like n=1 Tax=Nyctereutes procyonoides TaxID=34880 RepID=UPI002443B727|nr:Y-box-binding protein 2-B-like [Nyctereutes procyonoides]
MREREARRGFRGVRRDGKTTPLNSPSGGCRNWGWVRRSDAGRAAGRRGMPQGPARAARATVSSRLRCGSTPRGPDGGSRLRPDRGPGLPQPPGDSGPPAGLARGAARRAPRVTSEVTATSLPTAAHGRPRPPTAPRAPRRFQVGLLKPLHPRPPPPQAFASAFASAFAEG